MESILIVEDDATLRETLALNLRAEGYDVRQAKDGEAGLATARVAPADLVRSGSHVTWAQAWI